jgi:putative hydrolase of the HAD superfamily
VTDVPDDRTSGRVILVDIGGVLVSDDLTEVGATWGARLGISPESLLAAVYGGSDDQVLIGRVPESAWWDVVAGRLGAGPDLLAGIRRDLATRGPADDALLAYLGGLTGRAKVGLVSNAWPHLRARLAETGLADAADDVVLSSEVGYAKPDPRIFALALRRLGAGPADALFIDDTAGHVAAAETLGLAGHVHTGRAGTIAAIERFLGPPQVPSPPWP